MRVCGGFAGIVFWVFFSCNSENENCKGKIRKTKMKTKRKSMKNTERHLSASYSSVSLVWHRLFLGTRMLLVG